MKRNSAQTIFRTVVFAGAMLGAPACKKNPPAATTPPTNTSTSEPTDQTPTTDSTTDATDPCADPCAAGERPRGVDDDGGGGEGRGFILS